MRAISQFPGDGGSYAFMAAPRRSANFVKPRFFFRVIS
jgi:hypothetical protein